MTEGNSAAAGAAPAYIFPGQGAQAAGMADWVLANHPGAREIFGRGREILGFDVERICREGPEEELNSTRVSQPAIFLHSLAVADLLSARLAPGTRYGQGLPAAAAAGLSLGEYSALVFAGCLGFEEAVAIVGARGRFMQEACDQAPGGMLSILGLDPARVEQAVAKARPLGPIGIANLNSPGQIVISGAKAALDAAAQAAKELGARRVIPLKVAGAYHSPLMAGATARLRPLLEKARIRPPRVPFFANVTGARVEDPEEIRRNLVLQVESPVRWEDIFRSMGRAGVTQAVETGPGKVLAGLARSIDCGIAVASAEEEESSRKAQA